MRKHIVNILVVPALAIVIAGCGHLTKAPPVQRTVSICGALHTTAPCLPESSVTPTGAKYASPPYGVSFNNKSHTHIDSVGLHLIEQFEGFLSCPYWDTYGHVWTRGFGETEGISPGSKCISRAQAEARLQYIVETRYEWAINAINDPFNQNQRDSLDSTLWNLGAGIIGPGTELGDLLRARNYRGYAAALLNYDHASGIVLAGLKTRREEEARLFLKAPPVPYVPRDERQWRKEWDAVAGKRTAHANAVRNRLRPVMSARAKTIEKRANHEKNGWYKFNRQARHHELDVRLGIRKK